METQEQTPTQTPAQTPAPGAKPSAAAQQFQEVVGRLGQVTIALMQGREELEDKQRQAEALGAEITQLRLRLADSEREAQRLQGAAGALQTLVQAEGQAAVTETEEAKDAKDAKDA